jgi:hypothetical protein
LTQSLRLKSYLKPFLHFGFPLDQNGLDVWPEWIGLEGLVVPTMVFGFTEGIEMPDFSSCMIDSDPKS